MSYYAVWKGIGFVFDRLEYREYFKQHVRGVGPVDVLHHNEPDTWIDVKVKMFDNKSRRRITRWWKRHGHKQYNLQFRA